MSLSLSVGATTANVLATRTPAMHSDTRAKEEPPIRKLERVEVDAAPESAVIEIRTRNPEMDADWDAVWNERGYLLVDGQVKEIKAIAQERYAQAVALRVQGGMRARNLHMEKGNVFGQIALDKFLAMRKKSVEMAAVPRMGVQIDVRIYPPEINVETNLKWERD